MKIIFLIAFMLGLLTLGPHPTNASLFCAILVFWAAFIIGLRVRQYCTPVDPDLCNDEGCPHSDIVHAHPRKEA